MNGLASVNIELTSRCNKSCWCCGRRKIEKENPALADWGDMDFTLLTKIARQVPIGVTVQLHNNGEPLLYPHLGIAFVLFKDHLTGLDTNGKLLNARRDDIIDRIDTLTLSVIQDDPEGDEQWESARRFVDYKGTRRPMVTVRLLGNVPARRWQSLSKNIARRVLHSPGGSFKYEKAPTLPEIGICLEALHKLSIDRKGNVSMCVRFDPYGRGILGNLEDGLTLSEIWYGKKRKDWLELHKTGQRDKIPLCSVCEYWGVPRG